MFCPTRLVPGPFQAPHGSRCSGGAWVSVPCGLAASSPPHADTVGRELIRFGGCENQHRQADIDILVGANGRIEPEAADNRPEGRKGVSLCGCSRLSSWDRTIPGPAALDGNPYRRSNPEPGGPRYPLFGLLSRVRCFDAHRRVLQVPDF